MAFHGRYEHTIDSKDRLTIPARFRAALSDGVVLAKGLDPCVAIYPPAAFAEFSDEFLGRLNPLSAEARRIKRYFFANSFEESLDSAGRVRLPRALMDHAGLHGPCAVVGMSEHLEVWDPDRWAGLESEAGESIADTAERLAAS